MSFPIETLRKFLKLEADRNFDNRAVMGGLEKILPNWEPEAYTSGVDSSLIERIKTSLLSYSSLTIEDRKKCVDELISSLSLIAPEKISIDLTSQEIQPTINSPQKENVQDSNLQKTEKKSLKLQKEDHHSQLVVGMDAPLTVLQGIGPGKAQMLKSLDLNTLEDLLFFFPRRYDDYSQLKPINRLVHGEDVTVIATIQSGDTFKRGRPPKDITEIVVTDSTGFLRLVWWNQTWPIKSYRPGMQVVVAGRVDMYLGRFVISNPDIEQLEQEHLHTNRIVPVYSLTSGLTQKTVRRFMYETVSYWATKIPDFLPASICGDAKLINLSNALRNIHFPDSQETLNYAIKRLAFDEIFLLQLGVLQQKRAWQSVIAEIFNIEDDLLENIIKSLPFSLTKAQQTVLSEIRSDLGSGRPMNRLLQGDVGSGKTVIAGIAMAIVASRGAQAAIMAPTGILADQHYQNIRALFIRKKDSSSIFKEGEIRLLIGDTPEKEKQEIRNGLISGEIKLIIGTHALLEEPVSFHNLQLAVIDEQHRFGVDQRAILRQKGQNPHLLVMTATPIPRSLALTVYGDLDLSVMDEMPTGRLPIETQVIYPIERERAYQYIRSQVEKGHQAFIIYPLIDKEENGDELAAVQEYQKLQKDIFPEFKLGLLHGKIKPDEKDSVMKKFRKNDFQILVSTTVVEVGVDITNATVIMIEGANRFGLAQLHQLRGRVGRGDEKSFCLLVPDTEDAIENERLSAMVETNDGFILAERDLQLRGPGEFLGTRQSGYSQLRLANLTDLPLIESARTQAQQLFDVDPALSDPNLARLKDRVNSFWRAGQGDIS